MFTGLVEDTGRVEAVCRRGADAVITVACPFAGQLRRGESVAVNGVCLSVEDSDAATFTAAMMPETLKVSTMGHIKPGRRVNLERALRADARLGGHLVQGHVDGIGQVAARTPGKRWLELTVEVPPSLGKYIAYKGSICLDGVSLTVSGVGAASFTVSLIPQTLADTTLGDVPVGAGVNIETDMVARYLERLADYEFDANRGGAR